jgi:hypothetical protein
MFFLRRFADNSNGGSFATKLRRKRFRYFLQLIEALKGPLKILDLGGTEAFWTSMDPLIRQRPWTITLLNLQDQKVSSPNIRSEPGTATSLTQYPDSAFDIVFSNSLIEHLGTMEAQKIMAAEVRRVGRSYFIQTPYKHFPIEAHSLIPFFQYLPRQIQAQIVSRWRPGWYRDAPDPSAALGELRNTRLLDQRALAELFPEANIYRERVFGATKSLVAHSGFSSSPIV